MSGAVPIFEISKCKVEKFLVWIVKLDSIDCNLIAIEKDETFRAEHFNALLRVLRYSRVITILKIVIPQS